MNSIAIITARGGSKRIPKKNIKEFIGKPIIAYSIEAALNSCVYDEVMVSTDSGEIKKVALDYGAKVPFFRSCKTSDDYATTADVLLEVLEKYNRLNRTFKYATCIYPTAPFITSEVLIKSMNLLKEKKVDTVIPVVKFSYPPQRGLIIDQRGRLHMKWEENMKIRSQDLEDIYHDSGKFYTFDVQAFLSKKKLITNNVIPIIEKENIVQDIDTISDWEMAEIKYRIMEEGKNGKNL